MVAIKDIEMPENCYDCYRNMYCIAGIDGGWRPDKRVEGCPLLEIEERKVGKWIRKPIRNEKGGCIGAEMICSYCKKDNEQDKKLAYCPNCGAKMEGVENE